MDNCPICDDELNALTSFVCIGCKKIICETCTKELKKDECPFCRESGTLLNSQKSTIVRKPKPPAPVAPAFDYNNYTDFPYLFEPILLNTQQSTFIIPPTISTLSTIQPVNVDRTKLIPYEQNGIYQLYKTLFKFLHMDAISETTTDGVNLVYHVLDELSKVHQYMESIQKLNGLARRLVLRINDKIKYHNLYSFFQTNFSGEAITMLQNDIISKIDPHILQLTIIKSSELDTNISKSDIKQRKEAILSIKNIIPNATADEIVTRITCIISSTH